ncbi:MAG: hypothetical protein RLZZ324_174 [Candidatus Parcubacteria bacterium]
MAKKSTNPSPPLAFLRWCSNAMGRGQLIFAGFCIRLALTCMAWFAAKALYFNLFKPLLADVGNVFEEEGAMTYGVLILMALLMGAVIIGVKVGLDLAAAAFEEHEQQDEEGQ